MALYSILPVTENPENIKYVQVDYNGHNVLAVVTEEGYQLERLYTDDYTNYMDESLMPGTVLENKFINKIIG